LHFSRWHKCLCCKQQQQHSLNFYTQHKYRCL